MSSRYVAALLIGAACLSQACAPSTDRFDTLGEDAKSRSAYSATRVETADQGSGRAQGGSYSISKVTIGANYARVKSDTSPAGQAVAPGLHGNPAATQ